MNIVSFNQVIELNNLLKKKNLQFKVHIRDACGAQSFYIEILNNSDCEENGEESSKVSSKVSIEENTKNMYETMEQYFKNNKMTIIYAEDQYNFTIK